MPQKHLIKVMPLINLINQMQLMHLVCLTYAPATKITGGTPDVRFDKSLTNGPMDQSTSGPMDQWTNGPRDQWTNGTLEH